jgi:hypothetical protein
MMSLKILSLFFNMGAIKALSKQEGANVCWVARFLSSFFNFNQLPASKNRQPNNWLALLILSGH